MKHFSECLFLKHSSDVINVHSGTGACALNPITNIWHDVLKVGLTKENNPSKAWNISCIYHMRRILIFVIFMGHIYISN